MADFPTAGGSAFALDAGLDFANSTGTVVTAGSANVLGSYTTLVAAADNHYDSNWFELIIIEASVSGFARIFVNLAISSAAGDEFILVEDFFCFTRAGANGITYKLAFDIPIPAGVDIVAAVRSSTGSIIANVAIARAPANSEHSTGLVRAIPFGSDKANTRGTLLDPATINVMSPWVVIESSLPYDFRAFFICVFRNQDSWTDATVIIEVATGGVGDENTIYRTTQGMSASEFTNPNSPVIIVGTSKGDQISMRMSASALGGGDTDLDAVWYGI